MNSFNKIILYKICFYLSFEDFINLCLTDKTIYNKIITFYYIGNEIIRPPSSIILFTKIREIKIEKKLLYGQYININYSQLKYYILPEFIHTLHLHVDRVNADYFCEFKKIKILYLKITGLNCDGFYFEDISEFFNLENLIKLELPDCKIRNREKFKSLLK